MAQNTQTRSYTAKNENQQLALLRSNRRALRQAGFTGAQLQSVEKYFELKKTNPRTTRADVARVLGTSRQTTSKHLKIAEAGGLIVRLGQTLILFTSTVLNSQKATIQARLKSFKSFITNYFSENVIHGMRHRGQKDKKEEQTIKTPSKDAQNPAPLLDHYTAMQELKATYVPIHLRTHKT